MTTTETDPAGELSHQPTIPSFELPEYHGRKPVKMKTAIAGAGSRITRPHSIGDRIVLVVEVRVKSAGHEDTDDGLEYVEKYKVLDLFELDTEQGSRLISTVRSLYRTGEDAAKGRRPVPGLGETGYTDASGVVLTDAEVAELRGDPIRTMLAEELSPAVVVYDDGGRDLWPDDYPKDAPRPKVGDKYLTDGGDCIVMRLLHHETGEDLVVPLVTIPPANPAADAPELAPTGAERRCECGAVVISGLDSVELDGTKHRAEDPCFVIRTGESAPLSDADREGVLAAGRAHLAAVPDLPPAGDDYSGDLGDNVEGWEDATPPRPLTDAEREDARIAALLPDQADFEFVDCQIPELVKKLDTVEEIGHAHRLVKAEQQGRGRNLKPRAGALKWLVARVDYLAELAAEEAAQ